MDPNCWAAGAGAWVVEFPKGGAGGAEPNCGPEDAEAGVAPNWCWLEVDVVDDDDDPNRKAGGGSGAGAADVDVPKPVLCPSAGAPYVALCPIPD